MEGPHHPVSGSSKVHLQYGKQAKSGGEEGRLRLPGEASRQCPAGRALDRTLLRQGTNGFGCPEALIGRCGDGPGRTQEPENPKRAHTQCMFQSSGSRIRLLADGAGCAPFPQADNESLTRHVPAYA